MPSHNPSAIIAATDTTIGTGIIIDTVESIATTAISTIDDIDLIEKIEEIGLESTLELIRNISTTAGARIVEITFNNIYDGLVTSSNATVTRDEAMDRIVSKVSDVSTSARIIMGATTV
jgi:hypothetical protein